jgi:hypothetical protein
MYVKTICIVCLGFIGWHPASLRYCEWALCGYMQGGYAPSIHISPSGGFSNLPWLEEGANKLGVVGPMCTTFEGKRELTSSPYLCKDEACLTKPNVKVDRPMLNCSSTVLTYTCGLVVYIVGHTIIDACILTIHSVTNLKYL